jgi:NADH:ubiquinone oxidoreductase subunit 3 (subunit A)
MSQYILSPPIAFIILLIITYLLYKVGSVMGPRTKVEGKKLATYFCGEDVPGRRVQPAYHFFRFAFFFLILDVAALVIATVPSGSAAWLGILYLVTVLITVVILLADREVN